MKRQDKYPETSTYHYHNANPKHRITGDCVPRAICTALEIPYSKVVMGLMEIQLTTGYSGCCKEGYDRYLQKMGWIKHPQPRKDDNSKYTGKEFCEMIQKNRHEYEPQIIAHIGGNHITAIMWGKIYDIWNCSDGCIGNYWTRA